MCLVYLPLMLLDGIGLPGGILLCQQLSLANAITVTTLPMVWKAGTAALSEACREPVV